MELSRRDLIKSALAASVVTVAGAQIPHPSSSPSIDDFFITFTAEWIRTDPSRATSARFFTGDEADRLARVLTNRDLAWRLDRVARARRGLSELRKFDRSRMTEVQHVSADLLDYQLNTVIDEQPFWDYNYPLEQMNGANVNLVESLTVGYQVHNERDAENYIAVLGQVAARLDHATSEARRLAAKNVVPPRFILQATVKQMQNFTDPSPGQNPFLLTYSDKLKQIKDLPAAKQEAFRKQAEQIVSTQIYPSWKRAADLLQSQIPGSTDAAGIDHIKGGDEAYRFFLKRFTTTNYTPDEIHKIGIAQVARIEAQMDSLLRKLNRTNGTVKERIEKLKLDMQYPDPASEASRAQIMKDIDGIIADAQVRAAALFDMRPKSPVIAVPFPRFRESNAAANYNGPAPDGSRPGTFQYPRRIDKMTKFGLRSTVYHETIPGHHFQIALQTENKALPRFRQIGAFGGISALSEGWGLYAERLTAESGWYGDDTQGLLGQLDAEIFRARRLVVDTGLHSKGWTRQQGIDYGIELSEVERYAVYAGQACSYMMGELKLIELRKRALKTRTIREYHNKVLSTGTVPLDLLEKQINSWLKA